MELWILEVGRGAAVYGSLPNSKLPNSVIPESGFGNLISPTKNAAQAAFFEHSSGGDLLSHELAPAVPSALRGLTAVFGMGTGVTPSLWPPENLVVAKIAGDPAGGPEASGPTTVSSLKR